MESEGDSVVLVVGERGVRHKVTRDKIATAGPGESLGTAIWIEESDDGDNENDSDSNVNYYANDIDDRKLVAGDGATASSSSTCASHATLHLCNAAIKTPQQSAIHQIQEIFPLIDPAFILTKLQEPITTQSIQLLIDELLLVASYPKIEPSRTSTDADKGKGAFFKNLKHQQKDRQVDYANDDYERSEKYVYECPKKLMNALPFISKRGICRLLHHYNGRYHKAFMHIIAIIKNQCQQDRSNIENYEECMRLMAGGKFRGNADREKFVFEQYPGMRYDLTLKNPKKHRGLSSVSDKILLEELHFTENKMEEWGKCVQKERQRLVAREEAKKTGDTVDCRCCYADFAVEEMVHCMEGHDFCMDCVRRYVEERVFTNGDLGGDGWTELRCMDTSGCQSFFKGEQLAKSLSETVMRKYDKLRTTIILENAGVDDLCTCPQCHLQASLSKSQKVFLCPSCGFESCRTCGEKSHIPFKCEEVKNKTETNARLQIEEAMSQARIRYCPKGCKQGFFKVEGCNKMTCPTCKTLICYICRAEIPKKMNYNHFCQISYCPHTRCNTCPLYSDAEEDDARAAREAGLKTAHKLKHDSETGNGVKNMEDALKEEVQKCLLVSAKNCDPAERMARAQARVQAAILNARVEDSSFISKFRRSQDVYHDAEGHPGHVEIQNVGAIHLDSDVVAIAETLLHNSTTICTSALFTLLSICLKYERVPHCDN